MPDTYTTFLQEPEPKDREQSIEAYLKARLQSFDRAVAGYTSVSLQGLSGNVDLTPTQAKHRVIRLTGAPSAAVTVRIPYATGANADPVFVNACSGSFSSVTLKSMGANAGNGFGVSLATGKTRYVRHDGESVYPITSEQATSPALTSSLVAFWKLDEFAGVRVDSVGASHLTDVNTVTQNPGKLGGAAQFTAANSEYLSVADNAALSMGNIEFTVCAWVLLDSKTAPRTVCSKRIGGVSGGEFSLVYDNSADRFAFSIFDSTTGINTATANTFGSPSTGTWYFVVGKVEAGAVKISVNAGAFDSTAKTVTIPDSAAAFLIGAQQSTPVFFWDGRIDAVGLWKRALTSAEVTELYNGGAGREYPF
jgi:hypothetical protein